MDAFMDQSPKTSSRRPFWLLVIGLLAIAATLAAKEQFKSSVLEKDRQLLYRRGEYIEKGFQRMGKPRPGEWLDTRPEIGQTFKVYRANAELLRKSKDRKTIVIQPLGPLRDISKAMLKDSVQSYTSLFFDTEVRIADEVRIPKSCYQSPRSQYNASAILDWLKPRKPKDALCLVAITDEDMYAPGLNFVFGLASLIQGVGVYSFHRHGDQQSPKALFLRRGLKLLNHEIGHIFGISHCIYYRCSMNGTNTLAEADDQPLHYCPVCLRKLSWNLGFNVKERYHKLSKFYQSKGLNKESEWIEARLKDLQRNQLENFWRQATR